MASMDGKKARRSRRELLDAITAYIQEEKGTNDAWGN